MKGLGRAVDNFGDGIADSRNILGYAATAPARTLWDARTNNTVAYVTPDFSGLSATLAYVTDTGMPATAAVYHALCSWPRLQQERRLERRGQLQQRPAAAGCRLREAQRLVAASADLSSHIWRVVAGYSFAGAKIGALYEKASGDLCQRQRQPG